MGFSHPLLPLLIAHARKGSGAETKPTHGMEPTQSDEGSDYEDVSYCYGS